VRPGETMQRRRERILAAARGIIAEQGYDGLTMRALASASQVTVPTIYNLVGSKDEVLFAAVEEQIARFVGALERSRGSDPAAGVLAVVDACVRELLRLPRYYRSLLMLLFTSDAASAVRREVGGVLRAQFARTVAGLDRAGQLAGWVDREALVQRLGAHLAFTSLEWAAGGLGAETFRASALYDASLALVAACEGGARREFLRVAGEMQQRTIPRRRGAPRTARRAGGRRS
jgi:AcrR family transcriptional regulator